MDQLVIWSKVTKTTAPGLYPACYLFFNFLRFIYFFIEVQLTYALLLVSGVQQNDSTIPYVPHCSP